MIDNRERFQDFEAKPFIHKFNPEVIGTDTDGTAQHGLCWTCGCPKYGPRDFPAHLGDPRLTE